MHTGRATVRASHTSGMRSTTRERRQTDRYDDWWNRTTRSCVIKPNVRGTRKFGLVDVFLETTDFCRPWSFQASLIVTSVIWLMVWFVAHSQQMVSFASYSVLYLYCSNRADWTCKWFLMPRMYLTDGFYVFFVCFILHFKNVLCRHLWRMSAKETSVSRHTKCVLFCLILPLSLLLLYFITDRHY